MEVQPNEPSLTLFYSYAHEDEALRDQLEKHLSLLQHQGIITAWYDRQIVPGFDWAQTIDSHLDEASIILLLISADFLASDYCYNVEMQRALERHRLGEAWVIPVLLRPVDWHEAPFAHLQCLPRDAKPVTTWSNQDEAFKNVVRGIRSAIGHQRKSSAQPHIRPVSLKIGQDREHLLKYIHTFWIKGVLERSLHHVARIELGLQEQPDAVENPWCLEVKESHLPPRTLPLGTRISQVYDEADGQLLILGEPGAGKTTLLLELARDLLDRAKRDEYHPIPVVFPLASWAQKQASLAEWLVEELYKKYQIPRKIGWNWVNTNQVLPLLDGLDEVAASARSSCIRAINIYHQDHRFVPLVVCSRSVEYLTQTIYVALHHAVTVQPLTEQQINEYFSCAGSQLEALHLVLREDSMLQALATTPLMLSVLTLIYSGGKTVEEALEACTLEERRRQIFQKYIERMLQRRRMRMHYTPRQIVQWLSWLATQMLKSNQTDISLWDLSYTRWFPSARWRWLYRSLVLLFFGLTSALVTGPLLGLIFGTGLGFIFGTSPGLITGLLYMYILENVPRSKNMLLANIQSFVEDILVSFTEALTQLYISAFSCIFSLGFELLKIKPQIPISHQHRIGVAWWDLMKVLHKWSAGLVSLLINILIIVYLFTKLPYWTVGVWLIYGLILGWLDYQFNSKRKAEFLGDIQSLCVNIISWFFYWYTGCLPFNVPRFLDYATEHILLHKLNVPNKVGTHYIFIHHLLLEYFASLDVKQLNNQEALPHTMRIPHHLVEE